MVDTFRAEPALFREDATPLKANAMDIPTDREAYVVDHGGDIYRTTFLAL